MIDIRQLVSDGIDYAVEIVRQNIAADKHEREWWNTYRAALTGLCAADIKCERTSESLHHWARESADLAHGPLTPKAEVTP